MAKPLTLAGGRYDGFAFDTEEGFKPGPDDAVLYLGRATRDEWSRAMLSAPRGSLVTTTLAAVPYAAREFYVPDVFEPGTHEVYLRCDDGAYRTPNLAYCR